VLVILAVPFQQPHKHAQAGAAPLVDLSNSSETGS
jgi:hypothetical protein